MEVLYEKKTIKLTAFIFVILELLLYLTFLILDIFSERNTVYIKYSSIILCLVFASTLLRKTNADAFIVFVAMIFTLLADLFLLVLNEGYIFGVLFFSIVQIIYYIRLIFMCKMSSKTALISLAARFASIAAVVIILSIMKMLDELLFLSVFYFINLVISAIESFIYSKGSKKHILFAIGLTLFMCCDICVMLNNAQAYIKTSALISLKSFISVGMWLFYLPSQVLIVLSVLFSISSGQNVNNKENDLTSKEANS